MEGTSTIISWLATLAILGAAAVYYEWPAYFRAKFGEAQPQTRNDTTARPGGKRQKSKRTLTSRVLNGEDGASTPTSSNEHVMSKKRKIISAPVEPVVTATTGHGQKVQLQRQEDDTTTNKEFAKQLAKAQAGTTLESSKSQGQTKKERRAAESTSLGVPNRIESSGISTETSSTTGRDADDDMSTSESPASGPVSSNGLSSSRDITDMLEPAPAKPTTLRLTEIPETKSKPAASKHIEPVLTKKQRQRQARTEENKLLREEADRIHEAKKQEQLRRARMAAGTSNQSKANAFTAAQNPWQQPRSDTKTVESPPVPASAVPPLLDTFDASKSEDRGASMVNGNAGQPLSNITNGSATGNHASTTTGAGPVRPSLGPEPKQSWADEMSEEDQIKILKEQADNDAWESVTTKKSKKNLKKDNDTGSEASLPISRTNTNNTTSKANGTRAEASVPKRPEAVNRFDSVANLEDSGLKNSEW